MTARVASDDAETRACLYACLAHVFQSSPDADTVATIRHVAAERGIPGLPEETDYALSDVQREYTDLFVMPNPRYLAACESAIRDQGDAAAGAEAPLHVHQCYVEAGILPEHHPSDHIANELGFLAFLWSKQARAMPIEAMGWQDLRREFRQEHLLQWIGQLSELVSQRDRLGYYRVALQAVEDLLREEEEQETQTLAA
jgi:TorA maturation chaperone TorD